MLLPPEMARVHALGSREVLPNVVEKLYSLRELHVIDFKEDEFFERGDPIEGASDVSEKLIKVRSLLDGLGIDEVVGAKVPRSEVEGTLDTKFPEIQQELSGLLSRREELETKISDKKSLQKEIEPFVSLPMDFEDYSGYEHLEPFFGKVENEPDLSELRKAEHFTSSVKNETYVAVFVAKEEAHDAENSLSEAGFQDVDVPLEEGVPREVANSLEEEIDELDDELQKVETEIEEFRRESGPYLLAIEEYLSMDSEKKELPLRVAESENTFVIDGWIPLDAADRLEKEIRSIDDRIHFEVVETVEEEDPESGEEEAPVAYDNPESARPFETFTEMFGRPRYREVDPTMIIFAAFPIIYGMMLGDVGYGIGSLALGGYFLKKHTGAMKDLGYALVLAGASAFIFGIAYAEFLGPVVGEHAALYTVLAEVTGLEFLHHVHPPFLERNLFAEHVQIPLLVMISIWVGIIQVGGGFLIDFYNSLVKGHSTKHAVVHDLSWFILMGGILGMITSAYDILLMPSLPSTALYPSLAVVLAAVGMIVMSEGAIGIMEIPSRIFSHTFSFTRIAAIGLSSVGIALVINMFVEMFVFEMGGVFAIVGALLFVFGHIANLMLGVFASTLHSIRLQWVEFFTKFYEGGGKKFRPFGKITKYLEET